KIVLCLSGQISNVTRQPPPHEIVMLTTIHPSLSIWLAFFAAFAVTENAVCLAVDSPAAQRLKADIQRKQAETKRKIEQQSREIKAAHNRNSQQTLTDIAKARTGPSNKPVAAPFDAAKA